MADELDQQYMQTRQQMRMWQGQMFSMEPSVEGTTVHMGTQLGGKEQEGAPAGPPAQAAETLAPKPGPHDELIQGAAQRHGLDPALLKAVVHHESSGRPDVTSDKGATGLMQLMPDTAAAMGVQDATDPAQNIEGGAKYLASLVKKYDGDTAKALAAYNFGPGNIAKGKPLPTTTKNYVQGILSMVGDSSAEAAPAEAPASEAVGITPRREFTVDTPAIQAVRQEWHQKFQELSTGETAVKELGKVGKQVAEAVRPGFEVAAMAIGLDEDASATVGQAFVEFMGGLPGDESTDFGAGIETALAALPAVAGMYKVGKTVGGAAVEGILKNKEAIIQEFKAAAKLMKSERGSVPLGGGEHIRPEDTKFLNDVTVQAKAIAQRHGLADAIEDSYIVGSRAAGTTHKASDTDVLVKTMSFEDYYKRVGGDKEALRQRWDKMEAEIQNLPQVMPELQGKLRNVWDVFVDSEVTGPSVGGSGKPPITKLPPGAPAEPPISAKQLATIDKRERAKADFDFKVEGFKAELTKQRRGPVLSDEAVRQLAGESGFTLQDLLNLKPGSILAPEIQVKAREVFKASAEKMRTSAKAYLAGGDPAAMDDFAMAFTEAGMATTRIIGTYAEGGRTFRLLNQKYPSLKKAGKATAQEPEFSIQDQYIQQMYQFFKGAEEKSKMGGFAGTGGRAAQPGVISPGQLAQMVVDLPSEEAAMQFAAQALKPGWSDVFYEIWINGLLSGPVTHATNIISNAATIAWNIPERAVASMLHPQTVRPGEAAAMMGGVMESMGDAWRLAWKAFKEDQPQFGQSKLELPRRAITADALELTGAAGRAVDFLGTAARMPGRFLMAGDDFFKAIAFRAELRALAKRQAFKEVNELGLTGREAASKAKEIEHHILAEPPDSIKEAAQEFAAYTTFTRDLGEYGTKIQAALNFPMGRVIVPFIRTPTNIFKFAGERTPLALASRAVREELAAGGERAALAQAKIALGSLTMGYMAMLAANGMITGGGPKDKALRKQWEDEGWQPYSFKVGKEYISFARIEPLGSLIGGAADAAEIIGQLDSMKDEQGQVKSAELASALTVAMSRNIAQKTFVKGLAGTLNAVTSQDVNVVKSFLEKEVGSLVPGAVKTVAKTMDPVMRDVTDLIEVIQANIPGWSDSLSAERNIWGQVKMVRTAIGPDFISPIYNTQDKNDPVVKEMNRLNHAFTLPARNINGITLQKHPNVYWRYVELAANDKSLNKRTDMGSQSLHDAIAEVINGGQYKMAADGPQGGKIELIQAVIDRYRQSAVRALRQENKDLDAELIKQTQYKPTKHDAAARAKMTAPQLR